MTVSSSPRPLAVRTVSTSNERPITAAADSTWRATSPTGASRARSTSRAAAGSGHSPSAAGASARRYSTTRNGTPSVSSYSRAASGRVALGADQLGDLVAAQPVEPEHGGGTRAGRLGDDAPERRLERRAPREQHERRAPVEPAQPVGEQGERGVVGPLEVVDEQHASGGRGRERLPHAVEEAHLRGGAVERRGLGQAGPRLGERGDQPGRLGERPRRGVLDPALAIAHPRLERLDQRAVRQPGLLLVRAPREHGSAAPARVRQQLLRQPRLADAGLALDHHDVAAAAVEALDQRRPLPVPPDQHEGV